jgi:hypothetical protein
MVNQASGEKREEKNGKEGENCKAITLGFSAE